MPSSAKPTSIVALFVVLLVIVMFGLGLGITPGAAQEGAPADRCTGTLCDLYYGASAPEPPPKTDQPPTMIMVPNQGFFGHLVGGVPKPGTPEAAALAATPQKPPLVDVKGGGIIGMINGEKAERCTGTLCDIFYGGSPPEAAPGQTTPAVQTTTTASSPAPATKTAARHTKTRRATQTAQRQDQPRCTTTGDGSRLCFRR